VRSDSSDIVIPLSHTGSIRRVGREVDRLPGDADEHSRVLRQARLELGGALLAESIGRQQAKGMLDLVGRDIGFESHQLLLYARFIDRSRGISLEEQAPRVKQ
jgi:hypothetical protein